MAKTCDACGQAVPEWMGLIADDDRGEIQWGGRRLAGIEKSSYAVFRALFDARGRTLSKLDIMDRLYGDKPEIDQPDWKIVDVFVCKMNKNLRAFGPGGPRIENVWGKGYRLELTAAATVYATNADFGNAFDMNALEAAGGLMRDELKVKNG